MTTSLYDIPLRRIDGSDARLGDFRGRALLIVNVASQCGLTPQYEGLQKLYESRRGEGLEVLGFPANNFGAQEPGTDAEIATFCDANYHVTFPMFSKISVVGDDQHPLYRALVEAQPKAVGDRGLRANLAGYGEIPAAERDVLWNFEKFVVDRQGRVVARFAPDVTADDPQLRAALDAALKG